MTETARIIADITHRPRPRGAGLALVLALCALAAPGEQARAQNLIADPYFANGLPPNGSTDDAGNGYSYSGATATTFDGVTGIVLSGSNSDSYFQLLPVAGYDTNFVNYVFTFLAAAYTPDTSTTVIGGFAPASSPSCSDCNNTEISQTLTSTGLTQYTVTGTSTPFSEGSSNLYLINSDQGDIFVTGLDFEQGAPAPIPGAGILSLGAAIAGIAFHKMRRRRAD